MRQVSKIVLLLAVLGMAACAPKAFTPAERQIIEGQDSLMYVTTWPLDSAVLRTPAIDFGRAELASPLLETLKAKMLYTVQDPSQDGVGIAAPQVGIGRRLVCVQRFDKPEEPFECYVNVRIDSLSGAVVCGPEGCLSVPGLRGVVPRNEVVYLSYLKPGALDPAERVSERIEGFTAVIFQHECDHLNGVLYIDKAVEVRSVE